MRALEIDPAGYVDASLALRDANLWAAHRLGELGDGLADTGAMAGDSSFAEPFADGYDETAQLAVDVFADLVTSYATLGRYAFASVENHTRAELASVIGAGTLLTTDAPSFSATIWYDAAPRQVPDSLGGDPSSMPGWASWILDRVEGFVWPDADLDRLRRTGDLWRTAAAGLEEIAGKADFSVQMLGDLSSPEIPLAVGAVTDVAAATRDLADQCTTLGDACTGYAEAVEQQRAAILDLVHDLLRDALIIQGAGLALGFVTFGSTNAVATEINIAKIGAEMPRFAAMIEVLRLYSLEAKVALGARGTSLVGTELKLKRFAEARVAFSTQARIVQDGQAWARLRSAIRNPKTFNPNMVRGMSTADLRRLVDGWESVPAKNGVGVVFKDPMHFGRRVRIMRGYPANRPSLLTHGDYVVVSQNGRKFKIPLEGNPVL